METADAAADVGAATSLQSVAKWAMPAPYLTAAFYQFVTLPDFAARKAPLLALCEQRQVKGLILLAREGINSTIAGAEEDVRAVLAYLRADPLLANLQHKESWSEKPPFHRMKVRLKKEIVTMNVPGISPTLMGGTYVKPQDWNALIADPEVVVVDPRHQPEAENLCRTAGLARPGRAVGRLRHQRQKAPGCHVLHRRHPLRKVHCLSARARL